MIRIQYACLPGGGVISPASAALERNWYRDYGCPSCGGRLGLHRKRVPHGPQDHFEHKGKHAPCALTRNYLPAPSLPPLPAPDPR